MIEPEIFQFKTEIPQFKNWAAKFKTDFPLYTTAHQIGKRAIGAEGVGLVAEVVNDLQQTLLAGGGF